MMGITRSTIVIMYFVFLFLANCTLQVKIWVASEMRDLRQAKYICSVLPQLLTVKDCGVAVKHLIGFLPRQPDMGNAVVCPKLGKVLLTLRRAAEAASDLYFRNCAAARFRVQNVNSKSDSS